MRQLAAKNWKDEWPRRERQNIRPTSQVAPLIQKKASCACGGGCPSCQANSGSLKISQPNDPAEIEADQIADKVMRMADNEAAPAANTLYSPNTINRKCDTCKDEEETAQRKTLPSGSGIPSQSPAHVKGAINSDGRPLDRKTRGYFEPRFGFDLSQILIHTGGTAAESTKAIDARAYTLGNNIIFGSGEYKPGSESGKHLLAHELSHVSQNNIGSGSGFINRMVAANSNCPANAHGAPADPIAALTEIDDLAQRRALGASNVLFLESVTFSDPTFGRSYVFDAYSHWFGTPEQTPTGQWRSRFRTATFATENEAIAHELQTLSDRFRSIHNWLAGNVRYRCPGIARITIPGCATGTCGPSGAFTCGASGSRHVAICPSFWNFDAEAQAGMIVHEAIHPLFHFLHHGTGSRAGRGRNPGCYEGFIHEIFGTGWNPGDCTPI